MISISRSHAPADGYFTKEDPYFKSAGTWFGGLARRLGLEGKPVTKRDFAFLRWGMAPDGTPLLQNAGRRTPDGRGSPHPLIQIVANAPGDLKVLLALFPEHRAALIDAHDRAVDTSLPYIESLARVRYGKAGAHSMPASICAAVFRHLSERTGLPHLHTHLVLMPAAAPLSRDTLAAGPERDTLRLADRPFFRAQTAISAVYDGALAANLRALGLRVVPRDVGFEIEGVAREAVMALSPRRQDIVTVLERSGELGNAAAAERVTKLTRRHHPRVERPLDDLYHNARATLERAGFTREALLHVWHDAPTLSRSAPSSPREFLHDVGKRLPIDGPFKRHAVDAAAARESARHGIGISDALALAKNWLLGPDVAALPGHEAGQRFIRAEAIRDLARRAERLSELEAPAFSPRAIRGAAKALDLPADEKSLLGALLDRGPRLRLVLVEPGPSRDRLLSALARIHVSPLALSLTSARRDELHDLGFRAFTVAKALHEWKQVGWHWTPFVNAPHRGDFVKVHTSPFQDHLATGFGLISRDEQRFRAWQRSRDGLDFKRSSPDPLIVVDGAGHIDPASLRRILVEAEKHPRSTVLLFAATTDAFLRSSLSALAPLELTRLRDRDAERMRRELHLEPTR